MKKVFVLLGTNNKNGKTAKLLSFYLNWLKKSAKFMFDVEITCVYDVKVLPCDGCGFCFQHEGCPKNEFDDFLKIVKKIEQAHHFVLASCVFFSGFPAKLKAVIDRSEQFFCSKKRSGAVRNLKLRTGGLVLTGGNLSLNCVNSILTCSKQFFDCVDVELKNRLINPKTDGNGFK